MMHAHSLEHSLSWARNLALPSLKNPVFPQTLDRLQLHSRCVVNCAGAWAGYIAEMVGLKIPLIAMRHAYVTTDRIDGVQNKPNVRDHDASVYIKLQVGVGQRLRELYA